MNTQLMTTSAMIVVATAATLLPHPPNFTPMAAIALFAGARVTDRRAAFSIPLATLFLRDLIVGLHLLMPFTYACFTLSVCLGLWLKDSRAPQKIAGASLLGSVIFFFVTNLGVWLLLGTFPLTLSGLAQCYVAAIPYFRNTVTGDLFYTAIMFGTFALAQRHFPKLQRA